MKTYNVSTPALYGGTSYVDSTDSSIILTGNENLIVIVIRRLMSHGALQI